MIIVRNLAKNLECFYDFFKRKNSHEIYKKIMYILLNSTVIAFILCVIIGLNENIIGNPLGEKIFYLLGFLFFVLLIIGTTKNRKH